MKYVTELERIQRQVDRLFERVLGGGDYAESALSGDGSWQPAVDVVETPEAFLVYAELPGVRREDIQLEVRDRRLDLSGRRDPVAGEATFRRLERAYGPFRRSVLLGADVDADGVEAAYRQGVLEVTLPRRQRRLRVPIEDQSTS
ncbi:MAG: Hsp20/alpha crystallin family protein [Thermoanaerobaculia bacterium]